MIPNWTPTTSSQEETRKQGGTISAPEPILPLEFAIQLYNPDQQIIVKHKPASLTSAATWEFEMPSQSFRTPSQSQLDRSQSDPTASEFTSRLGLKWKKDGRLSKDLGCYISGRALNPDGTKNKHKEPDITIAILKDLKEVTIYEPNMARIELEDLKGFEVALLLGAVVIRDVYFGSMKDTFHILGGRKGSTTSPVTTPPAMAIQQNFPPRQNSGPRQGDRIPPTDPRSQWEIDRETERLRKEAAEEERQLRKREEAEQRQIRKMLEEEEKQNRRHEAAINAETERLRQMYGQEQHVPVLHVPQPHHHYSYSGPSNQSAYGYQQAVTGPYMSGGVPHPTFLQPDPRQQSLKERSSFFGFRRHSDQETNKIAKKKSTIW